MLRLQLPVKFFIAILATLLTLHLFSLSVIGSAAGEALQIQNQIQPLQTQLFKPEAVYSDVYFASDGARYILASENISGQTAPTTSVYRYAEDTWVPVGAPLSTTQVSQNLQLSEDSQGNLLAFVILYPPQTDASSEMKVFKYTGNDWTQQGDLTGFGQKPANGVFAIDSQDNYYVAYYNKGLESNRIGVLKYDGLSWGHVDTTQPDVSPFTAQFPQLVIDGSDRPVVSFYANSSAEQYRHEVRRYEAGTGWNLVAPALPATASHFRNEQKLLLSPDNEIEFLYTDDTASPRATKLLRVQDGSWVQIGPDLVEPAAQTSVDAVYVAGTRYVKYSDADYNYFLTTLAEGEWADLDTTLDTPYNATQDFDLYVNEAQVVLAFEDTTETIYERDLGVRFLMEENEIVVGDIQAVEDNQTVAYDLVGGLDVAQLRIDSSTGTLEFLENPDFELPRDTSTNNDYDLVVRAFEADGTLERTVPVKIIITDANDRFDRQFNTFLKTFWKQETAAGEFPGFESERSKFTLDSQERPVVAYASGAGDSTRVEVYRRQNREWTPLGQGPNTQTVSSLDLAVDTNDTPYLLVYDNPNFSLTVYVFENDTWSQLGAVLDTNNSSVYDLEVTSAGVPVVAYSDGQNRNNLLVKEFRDGSWSQVGNTYIASAPIFSLDLDATGDELVVLYDALAGRGGTSESVIVTEAASQWVQAAILPTSGAFRETAFVRDQTGGVHVLLSESSDGLSTAKYLYQASFEDLWTTVPVRTLPPGPDSIVEQTRIGLDTQGLPIISYVNIGTNELFVERVIGETVYDLKTEVLDSQLEAAATQLNISEEGTFWLGVKNNVSNAYNLYTFDPIKLIATTPEETTQAPAVFGSSYDQPGNVTFEIIGGVDAETFTLSSNDGTLLFKQTPDFENPLDTDRNNVYQLIVKASEPAQYQQDVVKTVEIAVTDVAGDETPVPRDSSEGDSPTSENEPAEQVPDTHLIRTGGTR